MSETTDKLRAMDPAELDNKLEEDAEQMFRLRFQMSMGQTDGVTKYRRLKKERAQALTIKRERELAEGGQQ